ncbi:hydrogenase nickel incorporation-associated protein hypb [hydrocarbon metagenome]|uniref:Hydrogenase nickel incorporation-associated protein hypb n=1 Tax=hydrocarbon metagenome TaxID=938273 RepID=A0A0W8E8V3_9ZZZZ
MEPIQVIDIRQHILIDNQNLADEIRNQLKKEELFMLNLMASPGAGKTSIILETIRRMKSEYRMGIVEGDIESIVDAEKIDAEGIPVVQIHTGGACHLDAPMIKKALESMDAAAFDLLIIENIGNLVCPAEFDTGAALKVMILSVPEGDDKTLKYPLMFSVCDALIINKIDYLPDPGFDMNVLEKRVRVLNPNIKIFPVSCRLGQGLDSWCNWLRAEIEHYRNSDE